MMLSFSEKRSLQRIVQDRLVDLESGTLSFQQKRAVQRELEDALNRLTGGKTSSGSLYDALVSGKFLHESPLKFLSILNKVAGEVGNDANKVHEPVLAYIETNLNFVE